MKNAGKRTIKLKVHKVHLQFDGKGKISCLQKIIFIFTS